MKNIFSSPSGLTKVSQVELRLLSEKLDVIAKNILYITYKVDKISKFQATDEASEYYDYPKSDDPDNKRDLD